MIQALAQELKVQFEEYQENQVRVLTGAEELFIFRDRENNSYGEDDDPQLMVTVDGEAGVYKLKLTTHTSRSLFNSDDYIDRITELADKMRLGQVHIVVDE